MFLQHGIAPHVFYHLWHITSVCEPHKDYELVVLSPDKSKPSQARNYMYRMYYQQSLRLQICIERNGSLEKQNIHT